MKFQTTYQDLNNRLMELDNIKQNSNTLYLLNAGRIEAFYKQNRYDIDNLKSKMAALFEAHVEKNDEEDIAAKGKYKFQKQVIDNNGSPQELTLPVFIDGHAQTYQAEYTKLMAQTFFLII